MDVSFRIVDVFAERPFSGNQLCVVPEPPEGMSTEQMQTLAQEIGFSESTFVEQASGAGYRMRIFTPDSELAFAGHPTLGTAFVLASEGRVDTSVVQTTSVGQVPVDVDVDRGSATMTQLPAVFGEGPQDIDLIARGAGLSVEDLHPDLPVQVVSTGARALIVPIRDVETLRRAERGGRWCAEAAERSGADWIYLFVIRGDGDVLARMFDPSGAIGEDPATGSAAGPLGAYLAARGLAGMPGSVLISQGEQVSRPSLLHVEADAEGSRVRVGGGVRIVGEGTFRGL